MISIYGQSPKSLHLRDSFIQNLCEQCIVKEIELPKQGQNINVFSSGKDLISQSSLMACIAVIELIKTQFDYRFEEEILRNENKKRNSSLIHE